MKFRLFISGHSAYVGIISTILMIASGVLTILAIKKEAPNYLWWAVYLNISIGIWLVLFVIIMLATFRWVMAIGGIINAIIIFYFASVLRSYAFEIEDGTSATANPA
ncbi:hypothetical protein Avbf_09351 [Armadillidium vulgare]|nr:hypothetical protein Avbf_09351 [Armadillidium vulgare]